MMSINIGSFKQHTNKLFTHITYHGIKGPYREPSQVTCRYYALPRKLLDLNKLSRKIPTLTKKKQKKLELYINHQTNVRRLQESQNRAKKTGVSQNKQFRQLDIDRSIWNYIQMNKLGKLRLPVTSRHNRGQNISDT